jgi:hypothetical protein
VELLVVDDSVLSDCEVFVVLFWEGEFLFFLLLEVVVFVLYIFIFDFDDIFFVLVDDAEQFSFDFDEMLSNFVFVEEIHFFFLYEVCMVLELPVSISMSSMFFFFMVEFQWFLMELSVRPGSILVISAHLLPCAVWARKSTHSSWGIHSTLRMLGFRWLCQRSRHCLPSRP